MHYLSASGLKAAKWPSRLHTAQTSTGRACRLHTACMVGCTDCIRLMHGALAASTSFYKHTHITYSPLVMGHAIWSWGMPHLASALPLHAPRSSMPIQAELQFKGPSLVSLWTKQGSSA